MAGSDLLARIDRAIAELQAVRSELAASVPTPAAEGVDDADDLTDGDLIDTHSASARFGYPQDSIRKWCREEDLGVRRGGRWLVSIPRLQKRLNGK